MWVMRSNGPAVTMALVSPRPRILVALEPAMFADAMAALLEKAGQDEVEVLAAGDQPHGHYDGAIVTLDLTGLDADVVIHLPDELGGGGTGATTTATAERDVELVDVRSVLEVLDEHCATARPRAAALRAT
jgi:hypothetical protein